MVTATAWLAFGLPLAAHAVQDCELDGRPVNVNNGAETAGKSGLIRCIDRDSRVVQREQELQNGIYMGVVRRYQEGRLFKEYRVDAKGNMEGRSREFSPGGKVVRDSVYQDSNEVGLVRSFHQSGTPRTIAFNGEGGREIASAEFTESGKLSALRCGDRPVLAPAFDDARSCGFAGGPAEIELFGGNGAVRQRATYSEGRRIRWESLQANGQPESSSETTGERSVGRRFWPNGARRAEVHSVATPRGSVRQRELEYSERGSLLREQRWSPEGLPQSDESFYLNGQPRSRSIYDGAGAQRTVEITDFHDSGQRARQGRFRAALRGGASTPIGTHQTFDERGILVGELVHDDRGRVGRERVFDAAGVLVRDDEVFEDGSRKAFEIRR
ncbi:MAG: hypothetical protein EOO24_04580 [Comamonadaceae bacterium]|nr:MAG: hypothetical protein EOO24_04580 [Comamonadaceae bacterium]